MMCMVVDAVALKTRRNPLMIAKKRTAGAGEPAVLQCEPAGGGPVRGVRVLVAAAPAQRVAVDRRLVVDERRLATGERDVAALEGLRRTGLRIAVLQVRIELRRGRGNDGAEREDGDES